MYLPYAIRCARPIDNLCNIVTFTTIFTFNAYHFSISFDAGMNAARITAFGLMLIGLVSQLVKVVGLAIIELSARREQKRLEISREQERFNRSSLEVKIRDLMTEISTIRDGHTLETSRLNEHLATLKNALSQERTISKDIKEFINFMNRLENRIDVLNHKVDKVTENFNSSKQADQ